MEDIRKISSNVDVNISKFLVQGFVESGIAVLFHLVLIFNKLSLTH